MFDVSLQLLCTARSGTLSRVIREINQIGLQYRSHQITSGNDLTHIAITAAGELNCTRESLEALFTGFPEVLQVQELKVTRDGKDVTGFKTRVTENHVAAHEQLTPAVLLAAEKRLSDILGPIASILVEAVSKECTDAAELYRRLAEELDDEKEREYFLSVVDPD